MGFCVLAAAYNKGTVAYDLAHRLSDIGPTGLERNFKIGHPTGFSTIGTINTGEHNRPFQFISVSTAKMIMDGRIFY